ncbi:hypothetical protein MTLP_09060 [Candidatus Methanoliparum sp. LAM-1]|nr:hypothetical protein MTLP_09060 [Candidatus Methanoliparum sp. LAM-1]
MSLDLIKIIRYFSPKLSKQKGMIMRRTRFFIVLSLLIFILSFHTTAAAVTIQIYGELSAESADFYKLGQLNNGTAIMVILHRAVDVQEGGTTMPVDLNIVLIDAKNNNVVESYTISSGETAHFTISESSYDTFYVLKVSQESSFMGIPLPSLPFISTPVQSVSYEGEILIIE